MNTCANEVESLLNNINNQAIQFLEEEKSFSINDTEITDDKTDTESTLSSPDSLSSSSPSSSLPATTLNTFLNKLFKLTKEWNYAMQVLSSVFSPHQPIVLTRKPFSERWHLSAFVMWVCLFLKMSFSFFSF